MKVILFGGTGMVGQGVLRECVIDARITEVLVVVRKSGELGVGSGSPKVVELVHSDFFDWNGAEERFAGYEACFFCLGTSAVGMKEPGYRRVTYDLTLTVASMLLKLGSLKTFIYVSGQGTSTTSRQMWARVKGETEDALIAMPGDWVFCFRPGFIQPLHGIRSKTPLYQSVYNVVGWMYPLLKRVAGNFVTSTEELGRAMIAVSFGGYPKKILEMTDIVTAAGRD